MLFKQKKKKKKIMMHAPQPQKLPPIGKGNKPKINTLVFIFIFKKDVKKETRHARQGEKKKIRAKRTLLLLL